MRFFRLFLDPAAGEPLHVFEGDTPFDTMQVRINGLLVPYVDFATVGEFGPVNLDGEPCSPSEHIFLRVEKHPLADSDPDAPKYRVKPEYAAAFPASEFCPASEADIKAHLAARPRDGLPSTVQAHLCALWFGRDDIKVAEFAALGMSAADIRRTPKIQRATASMRQRQLLVDRAADVANREAAQEARWARNAAARSPVKKEAA